MSNSQSKFRNVIACEDVREEVGNKKSLMGVFGGDILVAEIPARIWLAFYIEKLPEKPETPEDWALEIKQDNEIAAKATIHVDPFEKATVVLPRALVKFPKECTLSVTVSVNGAEAEEVLSKTVKKGDIQPR